MRPALPVRAPVRVPVRVLVAMLAAALVGVLVSVALGAGPASADRASESSGRPDATMGRSDCYLMDRVYLGGPAGGCSRTRCRRAGEQIRYSPNAETCTIGGRTGTSYGSEIDSRTCTGELHRHWVAAVNLCAANPHRDRTLIFDAPQCRAPYTAYLTTSQIDSRRATRTEAEGRYDVCVRPKEAQRLVREAARTGSSVRSLAVRQVTTPPPTGPPSVLVVGDSLTWRGTDELADLRPDWAVDGASGRALGELDDRLGRYTGGHGDPTGLVVALGTNPTRAFDPADLRADLTGLPATTPVMLVLPLRLARIHGTATTNTAQQVRGVDRAAALLGQLAASRPATCVADWRSLVQAHPSMLVDGTHQTRAVEHVWASFVSTSWDACVAATAPSPAVAPGA